jgi:hypothetical protein
LEKTVLPQKIYALPLKLFLKFCRKLLDYQKFPQKVKETQKIEVSTQKWTRLDTSFCDKTVRPIDCVLVWCLKIFIAPNTQFVNSVTI